MMPWADELYRHSRPRWFVLWTGAGTVVFALHYIALAWGLHQQPAEIEEGAPPPAIMIELAPEPEAVETADNQVAPDMSLSQEVQSETTEPVEQPPEEIEPEPTPPEPMQEEQYKPIEQVLPEPIEPEPIPEEKFTPLDNVTVPLPISRPKPVEKTKPKELKKKPDIVKLQEKKPPPRQQAAQQAQAQVKKSTRNAASETLGGLFSSTVSPAKWQARVQAHLARRKRSLHIKGEQGVAVVRFRVDDSGHVASVSLARSSGSATIDGQVVDMVRRASPVPAPPPGANKTLSVPIRFEEED